MPVELRRAGPGTSPGSRKTTSNDCREATPCFLCGTAIATAGESQQFSPVQSDVRPAPRRDGQKHPICAKLNPVGPERNNHYTTFGFELEVTCRELHASSFSSAACRTNSRARAAAAPTLSGIEAEGMTMRRMFMRSVDERHVT
jgi:hypothetical protein